MVSAVIDGWDGSNWVEEVGYESGVGVDGWVGLIQGNGVYV